MTTPDLSPAEVEQRLARAFLTATIPDPKSPGTPGRPVAEDSAEAVAVAMRIVGRVLEARDAEITRLREDITKAVASAAAEQFEAAIRSATDEVMQGKLAEVEAAVRADERERCAASARAQAKDLIADASGCMDTLDATAMLSAANVLFDTADLLEAGQPGEGVTA